MEFHSRSATGRIDMVSAPLESPESWLSNGVLSVAKFAKPAFLSRVEVLAPGQALVESQETA